MAITDDLAKILPAPVAAPVNQTPPSWVSDLIQKRAESGPRKKYSPLGFNFQREPFDPSSYYNQIKDLKQISQGATRVSEQEVVNREEAQRQREFDQSQQDILDATNGINPNFTYEDGGNYGTGSNRKYGLKGISPNTSRAANYFGGKYGIRTIGGRGPGSVPGSDHPRGRAVDFMINNISKGSYRGTALANDVIKNYKAWNVKYVIWNRYIWQPGRGWHKYHGPSPHTDHVHVSFNK